MLISLANKFPRKSYRKLKILAIVIVIVFTLTIIQNTFLQIGTINAIEGTFSITRANQTRSVGGTKQIKNGDIIKVEPYSRALIKLKGGTTLRLESGTQIAVNKLSFSGSTLSSGLLTLEKGKIWTRLGDVNDNTKLIIKTETSQATIKAGSINSTRRVLRTSEYYIHHGTAIVTLKESEEGRTVSQGQYIVLYDPFLRESFNSGSNQPPDKYINGWIRWNMQEDEKICEDNPSDPGCNPENYKPVATTEPTPAPKLSQPISTDKPSSKGEIVKMVLTADPNSSPEQSAVVKVIAQFNSGQYEDLTDKVQWQQIPELGEFTANRFFPSETGTVKIIAHYNMRQSNEIEIAIHPNDQ